MNHHKSLLLIGILMFACMMCASCTKSDKVYLENTENTLKLETDADVYDSSEENLQATVSVVYVCGAVVCPGVYELQAGARVCDAFSKAGGLLDTACDSYWNQAEPVTDGQKIYVPTEEEALQMSSSGASEETQTGDNKVNINTADKEELMTLPGIGETRAESIIDYRNNQGNFQSVEDIMNVSGIKDGAFAKMKDYIKVE